MRYLLCTPVLLLLSAVAFTAPPPLGWTTECKVVRVVDGDTLDVSVTKTIRIRLLDCWAPETSTPDGKRSAAALRDLATGADGVLFLPTTGSTMNMLSLNRALGYVWVNGKSLSELQVKAGLATKTKGK